MVTTRKKFAVAGTRTVRDLAYVEVASPDLARDINRDLVLEHIRAVQPISRVELARLCGLQPSTVSIIVEQLLEEGWISEGAVVKTARGRRPTMLSLNTELVVLVADVRPSHAVRCGCRSQWPIPVANHGAASFRCPAKHRRDRQGHGGG